MWCLSRTDLQTVGSLHVMGLWQKLLVCVTGAKGDKKSDLTIWFHCYTGNYVYKPQANRRYLCASFSSEPIIVSALCIDHSRNHLYMTGLWEAISGLGQKNRGQVRLDNWLYCHMESYSDWIP